MRRFSLLACFSLCYSFTIHSQSTQVVEYILRVESEAAIPDFIDAPCDVNLSVLDEYFNYYVASGSCLREEIISSWEWVKGYQVSGSSSLRDITPSDPWFINQSNLDIVKVPSAWEIATGADDPDKRDVVVAVLDQYFSLSHPDLMNNLWINEEEIPDDGIDNDNNGYRDDYLGYNWRTQNDEHDEGRNWHGASVAGIIAAEGDNALGTAGISWGAKIMMLSPVECSLCDDEMIGLMGYAYKMRKRWNDSNGSEGAFVVAANMSFGRSREKEEDFPEVCAMIDSLQNVGIIAIGAGPNTGDIDIDLEGDFPNDCSSDNLIAVTNSTTSDGLVSGTGFGMKQMDIAAPGDGTFTTRRIDEYGGFDGASASAPQIAGVIALMYELDCPEWQEMIVRDPSGAAALVRRIVLESADASPGLQDKVSSNGRLNALRALEMLREQTCLQGVESNQIDYVTQSDDGNNVFIQVELRDIGTHNLMLFDAAGRKFYDKEILGASGSRQRIEVDASVIPPGGYIAVLFSPSGEDSQKFVLTR